MSVVVRFVRENEVDDERVREAFRNVKASLRMPVVNGIFQAYATSPRLPKAASRAGPSPITRRCCTRAISAKATFAGCATSPTCSGK
jgi:hypothetical protein